MTPRRYPTETRCPAAGTPELWFRAAKQRLQTPLNRLTSRERFELLSALGKLDRTASGHLPAEARNGYGSICEKLANESPSALADVLAGHTLASWSQWTAQALTRPTQELLWQMLVALDDTEAAVAVVARIHPTAITPVLDELLSNCRTWIEKHGSLFASLKPDIQALCATLRPGLDEENYDLAVTTLKFDAILDPLDRPQVPPAVSPELLEALLRKSH